MNYKGNAFSLGKGKVSDARLHNGKIHFLQQSSGAYNHRVFDPITKSFSVQKSEVSFADSCWFIDGLLELFGAFFVKSDYE